MRSQVFRYIFDFKGLVLTMVSHYNGAVHLCQLLCAAVPLNCSFLRINKSPQVIFVCYSRAHVAFLRVKGNIMQKDSNYFIEYSP